MQLSVRERDITIEAEQVCVCVGWCRGGVHEEKERYSNLLIHSQQG